jgi:cobyrinic acid a,c-diamide synthase
MPKHQIRALANGEGLLLIEGAMGLFDGAPPDGDGATADLARILGLPVVLVVNAGSMSHSVAAVVRGFAGHDPEVRVSGVILNNVGSPRHEAMLRRALSPLGLPVLGALRRDPSLALPDRHLGLVQAAEHPDLTGFLDRAADAVADQIDLDALTALARDTATAPARPPKPAPKQIAIARDAAFSFAYPHQLAAWARAGSTILPFSPLADEAVPEAEFIFLPGGYPELHAATLAASATFLDSLREAAQAADIYGECGGYMVLGETLTDADGTAHKMAGLLGLSTSFAQRKLHLGYRRLKSHWSALPGTQMAHEFHYATTLSAEGTPLFDAWDAEGTALPPMGLIEGRVAGSFAHIIA